MEITKETLRDYGMSTSSDSNFPRQKIITNEFVDETELIIAQRFDQRICLILPDYSCLVLNVESIEDIQKFEDSILGYEV